MSRFVSTIDCARCEQPIRLGLVDGEQDLDGTPDYWLYDGEILSCSCGCENLIRVFDEDKVTLIDQE
jgi:hypothetical protein